MPELQPESLRNICDEASFSFNTTAELQLLPTIIGQERAVQALEFGVDIQQQGFNIYVAGPSGTGKVTALTSFLEDYAQLQKQASDWCYVQNFNNSSEPQCLEFPAGMGHDFQVSMKSLVAEVSRDISRAFATPEYSEHRDELNQVFQQQRDQLFSNLAQNAHNQGFLLQSTPEGLALVPHKDGIPATEEETSALSADERNQLGAIQQNLQTELQGAIDRVRQAERLLQERLQKMDQEITQSSLNVLITELKQKYTDLPSITAYLDRVAIDMVQNIHLFQPPDQNAQQEPPTRANTLGRYDVNVIVDNLETSGAPVIFAINPTHGNLLGRVEKEAQLGTMQTDFTMIRPGDLHRANGGFLIIRIEELLRDSAAWEGLKTSLLEQKIIIEELTERMGYPNIKGLTPEPIALNTKIILVGDSSLYHALYLNDPDFLELFKVKAEFDSTMDRSEKNIHEYASFIATLCAKEDLLHMTKGGVSKLIEHSSRIIEDQNKLSTRFAEISDIIREANHWAKQKTAKDISEEHVSYAIEQKEYRSGLMKEKILELIERDIISIDTRGGEVGQVNGLAVIGSGDSSFGRPSRITASVSIGREGLIDIEREAQLGGSLHTKGVMILGGYLTDKLSGNAPLSLNARLTLEQSYQGVEGDSASSTELYALLSRLAELPIKQGIAVTGSVNQKGEVQTIGGANHKIEGYFYVCQAQGLTGEQGVLIPSDNVQHLMLSEEVVNAVREGKFHIYSVDSIDEGIEILTGIPAGDVHENGSFEDGSVNQRVQQRLRNMAETMRDFMNPSNQ